MKEIYEKPMIAIIRFDHTDIITDSTFVLDTSKSDGDCNINGGGWTSHGNTPGCEKLEPTTKQNWNKCSA